LCNPNQVFPKKHEEFNGSLKLAAVSTKSKCKCQPDGL